uniref:DNA (Cytosine-5)-methyltransferase 1 n=1 Tax=Lygus hesperus TaxID=30085 RepID=A0A146MBM0_LYGHE
MGSPILLLGLTLVVTVVTTNAGGFDPMALMMMQKAARSDSAQLHKHPSQMNDDELFRMFFNDPSYLLKPEEANPPEEDEEDEDGEEHHPEEEDDDEDDDDDDYVKLTKTVKRMSGKVKQENGSVLVRCKICRQNLNSPDLLMFEGHPHNAVEECVALADPKLVESYDTGQLPQNKLTHFSIYDDNGHLCPLDTGIIEKNHKLKVSGYIKGVTESDPSIEGGIAVKELGPILQWWIGGYDGGHTALAGLSTDSGEYFFMEPSPEYRPIMSALLEKIYLGKMVIEFLIKEENASFEDLLNHIQITVPPPGVPKFTEEALIRHAQFVCDQVVSYDDAGYDDDDESDDDWRKLITVPCMRSLISLAGTTLSKRKVSVKKEKESKKKRGDGANKEKEGWSKATTTSLVSDIFETFFKDELDTKDVTLKGPKKLRCGVCEPCQQPDCGSCANCKDMIKFGGNGKSKQSCVNRKCPYMSLKEEEEANYESDDDDERDGNLSNPKPKTRSLKSGKKKVEWIGEPSHKDDSRNNKKKYYQKVMVGNEEICVGDFVSCEANEKNSPVVIGRVQFLWESTYGQRYMHLCWFSRGCETVLGESADPQELFLVDQCENTLLNGIISKVTVQYKPVSPDWNIEKGKDLDDHNSDTDRTFFYSKKYDELHGRFEDIPPEPTNPHPNLEYKYCCSCLYSYEKLEFENLIYVLRL